MRRLSLIIGFVILLTSMRLIISSPHGEDFKMNCDDCHTTSDWKVNTDSITFDHSTTRMPLTGQHQKTGCRSCHQSLIFKDADKFCASCHPDMHDNTVGNDCERCHSTESWIVNNIIDLHRTTRFPLLGAHAIADCQECHQSAALLRFEPLSIECYDCHSADYAATTSPNHVQANYSKECTDCHKLNGYTWSGAGINHDFFPLKEGHDIPDCMSCHTEGTFSNLSTACISCHEPDYNSTTNPNHLNNGFPQECEQCHSLTPGWRPANFSSHDQYFPIYSGEHNGEWSSCSDCHTTQGSFNQFSCIDCHEHNQSDMNEEHDDVSGYSYNSLACFGCHPTGSADQAFNHSTTSFPLTGAHTGASCLDCHSDGYAGTSDFCFDCHQEDFNQTVNPDHISSNIPNTCSDCHTTQPGWTPATFPIHSQFYALNGAHAVIANECASCHSGNYSQTPTTCAGCHLPDYNETTNPPHAQINFPTECMECHNETAWIPSTFNHDGQYFPIYSGEHNGEWDVCSDCHNNSSNFGQFTCIDCHEHNQTDMNEEHAGIQGYIYSSSACFACHPDGSSSTAFDHGNTGFPLTGAHVGLSCEACHPSGNPVASPNCVDCHETDYNQSLNPNHIQTGIPHSCAECHSTNPGWTPATFTIHNQYYALNGAHALISNDCSSCHQGNYNNTPTACSGCHMPDYNGTTNPNHIQQQFPIECLTCHDENAWQPSTFNHNSTSFPLTGAHVGTSCNDCHNEGYTNTSSLCFDCHEIDYNQSINPNHLAINIPTSCADCHTTIPGWEPADFDIHNQYYQLNGAHALIADNCSSCHNGNYNTTPNTCIGCHIDDYNQTTNPPHQSAQFPSECLECHTETAWVPSTFDHDNQYFPIYSGAHQGEWSLCSECHINPNNFSQFSCITCHEHNQADMDEEHDDVPGYVYNSTACFNCHPDGESKSIMPLIRKQIK